MYGNCSVHSPINVLSCESRREHVEGLLLIGREADKFAREGSGRRAVACSRAPAPGEEAGANLATDRVQEKKSPIFALSPTGKPTSARPERAVASTPNTVDGQRPEDPDKLETVNREMTLSSRFLTGNRNRGFRHHLGSPLSNAQNFRELRMHFFLPSEGRQRRESAGQAKRTAPGRVENVKPRGPSQCQLPHIQEAESSHLVHDLRRRAHGQEGVRLPVERNLARDVRGEVHVPLRAHGVVPQEG